MRLTVHSGICAHPWVRSGDRRQQRDPVLAFGLESVTFHRALLTEADPPPLPCECDW